MSDQEQIITAPCGDCIEGSRIDGDRAIKCRNGIVPMCAHVALKDRNAALEQMATDAVFAGAKHKQEAERLEKELDTQRQGFERLNIEQANEIERLEKELAEAKDHIDKVCSMWGVDAKRAERPDWVHREKYDRLEKAAEMLETALEMQRYSCSDGCFCEISIGNPNLKEHTEGCLDAKKALAAYASAKNATSPRKDGEEKT